MKKDILIGGNHYFVWFFDMFLGIGRYDITNKDGHFVQSFNNKNGNGYNHFDLFGNNWELATTEEAEKFYKESEEFHY